MIYRLWTAVRVISQTVVRSVKHVLTVTIQDIIPGEVGETMKIMSNEFANESFSPGDVDRMSLSVIKTEGEICFGCSDVIVDRYLLQVSGQSWHVNCLRCCVCQMALDRQSSCYMKDGSIYCKMDYSREFGTKCAKCFRNIHSNDWVRRARDHVYHLACFACDSCKRQLSTGEEFALQDNRVLCKTHYMEIVEGGSNKDPGFYDCENSQKSKTKRIRTTFSEEQVQVLQANFQLDSNPDGQDLERIAQITGLSKRVTQVWFQNSRARQKKHQQQQQRGCGTGVSSPLSMGSPNSNTTPPHWRHSADSGHSSDGMSFSD